jgi:hypothetical protein
MADTPVNWSPFSGPDDVVALLFATTQWTGYALVMAAVPSVLATVTGATKFQKGRRSLAAYATVVYGLWVYTSGANWVPMHRRHSARRATPCGSMY